MKKTSVKADAFTKQTFENLRKLMLDLEQAEAQVKLKTQLLEIAHEAAWGLVYSKYKLINPKKKYAYNYETGLIEEKAPAKKKTNKKTSKKKGRK